MSKKKHNIAYIKPEEPKFLRELKAAAGFKEGPDVDTKRQGLEVDDDDDREDRDEEQPTVVVLKEGDLTAEEAEEIKKKQDEEEANTPADLSKRVIFDAKRKSKSQDDEQAPKPDLKKKKSRKSRPTKSVLSFNDDEEDE